MGNCSTEYNKARYTLYFTTCYIGYTFHPRSAQPEADERNIYSENPLLFLHNICPAAPTASQDVFQQTLT